MNRNAEGEQILTAEKLPALHAAVMAACADTHGVIEDPRACAFDPASMRCPDGADQPDCLTDDQIRVVRDEYRGPPDAQGRGLFDGGEPYGSELAWAGWLVMPAADAAAPGDTYRGAIRPQLPERHGASGPILRPTTPWAPCRSPPRCTSDSSHSAGSTTPPIRT